MTDLLNTLIATYVETQRQPLLDRIVELVEKVDSLERLNIEHQATIVRLEGLLGDRPKAVSTKPLTPDEAVAVRRHVLACEVGPLDIRDAHSPDMKALPAEPEHMPISDHALQNYPGYFCLATHCFCKVQHFAHYCPCCSQKDK